MDWNIHVVKGVEKFSTAEEMNADYDRANRHISGTKFRPLDLAIGFIVGFGIGIFVLW
ncbi:MAG: hypothetical protein ACPG5W_11590 [Flavobacteriales bacterium]